MTAMTNEIAIDEACWIYEQIQYAKPEFRVSTNPVARYRSSRPLEQDLSHPLIKMLQHECTSEAWVTQGWM